MNRTKQMMKQTENSGTLNVRRKVTPGRHKGESRSAGRIPSLFSRRGMVTGLALLLSAGMCGGVRADIITFTYIVTANTCTLKATGTTSDAAIGASSLFDVDWGSVTLRQLTAGNEVRKDFGVLMDCDGLPWQPSLTITGKYGLRDSSTPDILYASELPDSAAGFAVMAATSDGATETDKTVTALKGTIATPLNESTVNKKILLTAWPVLMPGKSKSDLNGVTTIKGAVTITVNYN
ncbi:type 1 fimbrial protein [Morganella morganii]|nr:type 1 fimbrial protein [Morganella morganii]